MKDILPPIKRLVAIFCRKKTELIAMIGFLNLREAKAVAEIFFIAAATGQTA
jgi:hypothetical protein